MRVHFVVKAQHSSSSNNNNNKLKKKSEALGSHDPEKPKNVLARISLRKRTRKRQNARKIIKIKTKCNFK